MEGALDDVEKLRWHRNALLSYAHRLESELQQQRRETALHCLDKWGKVLYSRNLGRCFRRWAHVVAGGQPSSHANEHVGTLVSHQSSKETRGFTAITGGCDYGMASTECAETQS